MTNTHSRCPVRWHHFNALRWGKQKKEKKEKKNTSGRKRIGGMTTAHIVTKRGPMVHGIQFYISRVLKDKKGRETKSKKKKEEGERKRRCLLRSFDIFETLFIADTYIRPLFPPGRADPRWDGNSMEIPNYKFAKFLSRKEDTARGRCLCCDWMTRGKERKIDDLYVQSDLSFSFSLVRFNTVYNCISRFFFTINTA